MSKAVAQAKPSGSRHRWPKYSLRTLLGLVLAASIIMTWVTVRMRKAKRQQQAAQAIEDLGGMVLWSYQIDKVEVDVYRTDAEPPGPAWLRKLVGDDFFKTADSAQVSSDAELEHLRELNSLRHLNYDAINGPASPPGNFTDEGLKNIEGLVQLRSLTLRGPITAQGLTCLRRLKHLEQLDLRGMLSDDDAFENLEHLTELRTASLGGGYNRTNVTDAALDYLVNLRHLQTLDLSLHRITDAGLDKLHGLTKLKTLNINNTGVTEEGVNRLQQALPNCTIHWTPSRILAESGSG